MFLAHKNQLVTTDYIVLNQYQNKKVLVNHNGYKLVSNVCPHQQSLISTKAGKGNRVCPYHNWTFDLDGSPVTSGRTEIYCKNTQPLESQPVYEWNSLLFTEPVMFAITQKFNRFELVEQRTDIVNSNYRIIMDLFLDVDHIQSVHSGVYDQIGITDTNVDWNYTKNGSCQTVKQGAYWIAVYPNTMIEWQKGALFITVAEQSNTNQTNVHVFKFKDPRHTELWELNNTVWETAWQQDKSQAEIITEFPNLNLEPQKTHYRDYLTQYDGINQE